MKTPTKINFGCALTDDQGNIFAEQSFDAWGRKRNPDTWGFSGIPSVPNWLYRGYTGHEHLPEFGLIHMNGRMYDPILGRMLSPDNYVHGSLGTQGFNRYSYAGNNPLKYSDPSGEVVMAPIVTAMIVGGMINLGVNMAAGNVNSVQSGIIAFGIGALAGGLSFGAASIISPGIGFVSGAISGGTSGLVGGLVTSSGNAWLQEESFAGGLYEGLKGAGIGLLAGGLSGGVMSGILSVKNGGNFWTGEGATFAFSAPVTGNTLENDPVPYNTEAARRFSEEYIGEYPEDLNGLYANGSLPPGRFTDVTEDGYAVTADRTEYAQGITTYLGRGKGSSVHLYKAAFRSHEQLYLVMQHEYMHVRYYGAGLMNYNKQEAGARMWTMEQGAAWGYKTDILTSLYNDVARYTSPRYHYSKFGINILTSTPW